LVQNVITDREEVSFAKELKSDGLGTVNQSHMKEVLWI
jgi:hypothetical protein